MVDLDLLRVSLTKNGYFKVAELVKRHAAADVLDHVVGDHDGININRSQIANMMDADPYSGQPPEYWDAIREHGDKGIDAFTIVAMLFSHHTFIRLLRDASENRPEFTGYFLRTDVQAGKGSTKVYTNLAYALGCFGLSQYRRGAGAVEYDLAPAIYHLRDAGHLVRSIIRRKLVRAGWRDPALGGISPDHELMEEMQIQRFHRVLSMEWSRFSSWLDGHLPIARPAGPFGLREVRLFNVPPTDNQPA